MSEKADQPPLSSSVSASTNATPSSYDLEAADRNSHRVEHNAVGYALIANFQSSDRDFLQYRGFFQLHSRVLSALQADIGYLETELDSMDEWDINCGIERRLACLRDKKRDDLQSRMEVMPDAYTAMFDRTRPDVMLDLRTKLVQYDEMLLKTREVYALQRPAQSDYNSVRNWFDAQKPVVRGELDFIQRKEDLITLRDGRESASFDEFVERCLHALDKLLSSWCRCQVIKRIFITEEMRQKTNNLRIYYYAPQRVDTLVNLIITAIIFTLLVVPVVLMYEMAQVGGTASPLESIGILTVFTLLFGLAMSALTTAKRQELFAASAAYCAVLVVFVSNFGGQQVKTQGAST
ncbi:hypothetical protein LTR91_004383 [Friedmanniomyces endolithicus]|uniref:DUF6594 domain-containing protein n=1 Tax=Friedmanniomyces endolithicus TaxID=329885 RepID=A0AAN6QXY1_9PEZI|nr:hypothetical protein LTR94_001200 [Friedmanniomyces endolithicus]KAK0816532.1 hypothetical protein LTR59_000160 [Friedmanniomyces endolithicus]KAK0816598.1 hypothetical protein LTR38_001987 [Friedmanniomyces endolithicus]KAK0820928.1 hypothetical protein LTR75_001247 [Friedmanniomyces endolithicus]KAK0853379.1 hypothetical protein LTR03_002940 [Friedmanniomyces endolithicus]